MIDRYRVYTNTGLLNPDWLDGRKGFWLNDATWVEDCNKLIAEGWIPLGGVVKFGNSGLMQTMYKPEQES